MQGLPAAAPAYLRDVIIILAAAVAVVPVFRRLRASAVLGYLVAGVLIGPHGLDLVRNVEAVEILAQLGVLFLLFAIGLEISLDRLLALRRYVFGLGTAQLAATAAVITGVLYLLGMGRDAALVLGGGLSLSSTAVVMQMLVERRELSSTHGRVAFSVLLLQDLAVVPLLVMVPLLGHPAVGVASALALSLLKAAVALGVIVALGRFALRPLLRGVARAGDSGLFTGIALLLVLGIGWVTDRAGLSMALGAFLAGVLIAETEYRPQVEGEVEPFRGILLALFFMTVGMGVQLGLLVERAPLLLLLLGALLAVKALLLAGVCRAFGLAPSVSAAVGLTLAQGGEFAFVLFAAAGWQGALPAAAEQLAVLVVALSMAATPLLLGAGDLLRRRLARRAGAGSGEEEAHGAEATVLIAGFGRVGQTLVRLLERQCTPYVALDLDAELVAEARARGVPVFFGDASRPDVLRAAGADDAVAAVVTLDHPSAASRAVRALRTLRPELPILVRARDAEQCDRLLRAGATAGIPELVEGSLRLGGTLLRALGRSPAGVEQALEEYRRRAASPRGERDGEPATAGRRRVHTRPE